jgi:predicted HicB family RNase H-like nuclease
MRLQALSLLELLSHREAYCGLLDLAEILKAEHRAGKLAATGARYYRELLEDCYYPLNEALKKRSDTFAIRSNPEEIARALPKALELLHELLVELTGGRELPDASTTKGNRLEG